MKRIFIATTLMMTAAAGAVMAETMAAGTVNHDPDMPAVTTSSSITPAMPAAGANSFTQEQAVERFNKAGYSKVANIAQDKDGVWRATGRMKGVKHTLALDYQGNVTSK